MSSLKFRIFAWHELAMTKLFPEVEMSLETFFLIPWQMLKIKNWKALTL